ncbi:calcitonin gene-related peptide type 1 receptor-like [Anguilla rostrata]|uniref:Calcitonin receptor n=1 Tax=Anguilla anguilla TaxID=7936 RepID=A0A9D3M0P8_ANGAN|nr:calcitonin gene-related peptide type 1 receptor-like [Anguilla anguilla]KAG5836258.1 hypothetical protein ANANG_G00252680 [Anguilla anguilla]
MRRTQLCWVALLLPLVAESPTRATTLHEAQPAVLVPTAAASHDLAVSRQQIMLAQFECYLKIISDPPNLSEGPFCNRTWDGWLCWEDSSPGTAVQHCPVYFQDFDPSEKVTKVCGADGRWFHHPESNRIWSNYTQCTAHTKEKLQAAYSLYYLAIVGHGLSVASLLISLCIFFYFKSLSCQRISLHKNMFFSFILNSVCTVVSLSVVANNQPLIASNPIGCKVLSFLNSYALGSNYFWMLCEGIYLHTLIIVAVFAEEQQLSWYFILGWVFPLVPATTHALARWLFYNDNCWISSETHLLYIVHGPIYAALLVNLFFLLNIVRVLITKLRVTHCTQSNTYMKAVRATLILVPLLGVQFVLFPWTPEGRLPKAVYEFVMHIFTHYQGLLVATIFCFCNGEVQTVLKRQWTQLSVQCMGQLVTVGSRSQYYSSTSSTEMSRTSTSRPLVPPTPEPQKVVPSHPTIHST